MTDNDFEISILRLPHGVRSWDLVGRYYELRSDAFVGRLGWPLSLVGGKFEAEEYDCGPLAHYVIAHRCDEVLAGARLINCSMELGQGPTAISYMVRDAYLGRINMPSNIWTDGDPPTDDKSWELTRLVSGDKSPVTTRAVLDACNAYIKLQGAVRCIFLTSPAVLRLARRYGFDPVASGPIVDNGDGRFLAFECPVR